VIVLWSAIVHAAFGWALAGPPFIYLADFEAAHGESGSQ